MERSQAVSGLCFVKLDEEKVFFIGRRLQMKEMQWYNFKNNYMILIRKFYHNSRYFITAGMR